MNRREFLTKTANIGVALTVAGLPGCSLDTTTKKSANEEQSRQGLSFEKEADLIVIGGGFGGCASALAACRNGLRVIMTEETIRIGGQVATQGVPPDEHQWIETTGAPASYREYRRRVRDYYRSNYPLTDEARANAELNPGSGGVVGFLSHEPIVTTTVLQSMLAPYISAGLLTILYNTKAVSAGMKGDTVDSITVKNLLLGDVTVLHGKYFVDATDLGDLLPLTGTEYVTGAEARKDTGELHAPEQADPSCIQAWTYCFGVDYIDGEDHTIEKPKDYEFWRDFQPNLTPAWAPGKLFGEDYVYPSEPGTLSRAFFNPLTTEGETGFDWWNYRKIINKDNFKAGTYRSDITMVNWPQNDYISGNIVDVDQKEYDRQIAASKQMSLSLLYWLQTECPRRDGKTGWRGLRLRGDLFGTDDGLALAPYIREGRRIKALTTITEKEVGKEQRFAEAGSTKAFFFKDSVGIGYYHIDLHPTCSGVSYIDTASLPFQIPLGALIPVRVTNLIPACKNIGTTHITNGCYRLHPVEWSIGEAAGCLAAFALTKQMTPRAIHEDSRKVDEFQTLLRSQGVETEWNI